MAPVAVNPPPGTCTREELDQQKIAMLVAQVHHLETDMQAYRNALHGGNGGGGGQGGAGGSGNGGGGGGQRKVGFKFPKCADCERDNKYCNHCRKCGEEGHKKANCPKN